MITTEDWIDFFPQTEEGIRPDQERAINFILNRLAEGEEDIFFQGAVGVGKSFVAWVVAVYGAVEWSWKTRILVPTKFLQTQYMRDFQPHGMRLLKSSVNYLCDEFGTCDVGRGTEIIPEQKPVSIVEPGTGAVTIKTETLLRRVSTKVRCKREDCPYMTDRSEFMNCAIGVTNTAYALTCTRYGHPFTKGTLIVVDEAHKLANEICDLFEVSLYPDLASRMPKAGEEISWMQQIYLPLVWQEITRLTDYPGFEKQLATYETLAFNLSAIKDPADWLVLREKSKLRFQPLWAKKFAPELLDRMGPRRLFMSGTFLDVSAHYRWLGLDKKDASIT